MKTWYNKVYFIIAILGILLSLYLWNLQVSDGVIPCTTGGCHDVLTGEYGKLFGIPMSIFGLFFYVSIAYVAFLRMFIKHKLLDWTLLIQIFWGIIFSLYLRYLEFFVIYELCSWCWISVFLILGLLITFIIEWKKEKLGLFSKKSVSDKKD